LNQQKKVIQDREKQEKLRRIKEEARLDREKCVRERREKEAQLKRQQIKQKQPIRRSVQHLKRVSKVKAIIKLPACPLILPPENVDLNYVINILQQFQRRNLSLERLWPKTWNFRTNKPQILEHYGTIGKFRTKPTTYQQYINSRKYLDGYDQSYKYFHGKFRNYYVMQTKGDGHCWARSGILYLLIIIKENQDTVFRAFMIDFLNRALRKTEFRRRGFTKNILDNFKKIFDYFMELSFKQILTVINDEKIDALFASCFKMLIIYLQKENLIKLKEDEINRLSKEKKWLYPSLILKLIDICIAQGYKTNFIGKRLMTIKRKGDNHQTELKYFGPSYKKHFWNIRFLKGSTMNVKFTNRFNNTVKKHDTMQQLNNRDYTPAIPIVDNVHWDLLIHPEIGDKIFNYSLLN